MPQDMNINPPCPHCQGKTNKYGKNTSGSLSYRCTTCRKRHTPEKKAGRPRRTDGLTPQQAWNKEHRKPLPWKGGLVIHFGTQDKVCLCGRSFPGMALSTTPSEVNCQGCKNTKTFKDLVCAGAPLPVLRKVLLIK
jgi:hypothetical protein